MIALPLGEKNVCAVHTLDIRYCGVGVARKGGNSALEVPCAPKQAGRRLVFGGGNSPNQDTWQKNKSVLRMLCKYDTMARVPPNGGLHLHTHATHTDAATCYSEEDPEHTPTGRGELPDIGMPRPPTHLHPGLEAPMRSPNHNGSPMQGAPGI